MSQLITLNANNNDHKTLVDCIFNDLSFRKYVLHLNTAFPNPPIKNHLMSQWTNNLHLQSESHVIEDNGKSVGIAILTYNCSSKSTLSYPLFFSRLGILAYYDMVIAIDKNYRGNKYAKWAHGELYQNYKNKKTPNNAPLIAIRHFHNPVDLTATHTTQLLTNNLPITLSQFYGFLPNIYTLDNYLEIKQYI